MITFSYVPVCFKVDPTVLIDKIGDASDCQNWKPITHYSIVRRFIKRVLEMQVESQINLNSNQLGFVSGVPCCIFNTKIINACLKDAMEKKRNYVVAFLDIFKAFNQIINSPVKPGLPDNIVKIRADY